MFADHLLSLPYLSPEGRAGARTAVGGMYEITRLDADRRPYMVLADRHGKPATTWVASLAAALDAVIAHRATGGKAWTLDGTPCPARASNGQCTLMRGAHQRAESAGPAPKVWHRLADGREWRGMAA